MRTRTRSQCRECQRACREKLNPFSAAPAGAKKPPCGQTLWQQHKQAEVNEVREPEEVTEGEVSVNSEKGSPNEETGRVNVDNYPVGTREKVALDSVPKSIMEEALAKCLQNWPRMSMKLERRIKKRILTSGKFAAIE